MSAPDRTSNYRERPKLECCMNCANVVADDDGVLSCGYGAAEWDDSTYVTPTAICDEYEQAQQ